MTQKNMNKKIVNIPYFIWVMFIFFVFSGNASTYANEAPGGAGNQNEATLRLLSVVKNASTSVEEIVELIQEGALVNAADSRKCTPLMFAAEENSNPDVLKVLIEVGALVNATDRNGFTPLMRAAAYNSNPQIMRDLIERGADVAIRCRNGKTALDYAGGYSENLSDEYKFLWKSTVTALKNHTEELLSLVGSVSVEDAVWLIQEGADFNAKDNNGKTPLMIAAQYSSNHDILRLLIENKADVGIKDKEGKRAIDYAEGNEQLKRLQSYNLRGVGIADDIDFNLYHPWSNKPTR
ncbi:MAG: ankyrin repeat domain-containing protein, partial [Oscillospiraceae bacterium]|nr:ankyrin repeat domain-containing protein [Oscillospiraceae bacterium]